MICLRVTVVNSRLQLHEVYKDSLSKSRPLQTHNHIYFEAISLNVAGCLYVATMLYRIYTWTFDIKKHVGNFYSHISLPTTFVKITKSILHTDFFLFIVCKNRTIYKFRLPAVMSIII